MSSKKPKPFLLGLGANKDTNAMLQAIEKTNPGPGTVGEGGQTLPTLTDFNPQSSVHGLAPGQYVKLPINVLVRSNYNARVFYNQREIDETARSMAKDGQQVPALGYVNQDNQIVLIDGGKRLTSCIDGKISTLNVLIIKQPESVRDEYELSRTINDQRSTQTPFDDAVRWRDLLEAKVYSSGEELAKSLQVTPPTVSKTLGLNRIPPVLQRIMAESPRTCALTIAYEVSGIFGKTVDPDELEPLAILAEEVVQSIVTKDLNRAQTIELINAKTKGPKSRIRGETTPVRYHGSKGEIKVVPQRGELTLSIKGLTPEYLEELKTRIQVALAPHEGQ